MMNMQGQVESSPGTILATLGLGIEELVGADTMADPHMGGGLHTDPATGPTTAPGTSEFE